MLSERNSYNSFENIPIRNPTNTFIDKPSVGNKSIVLGANELLLLRKREQTIPAPNPLDSLMAKSAALSFPFVSRKDWTTEPARAANKINETIK
jgi:hypothetical protein